MPPSQPTPPLGSSLLEAAHKTNLASRVFVPGRSRESIRPSSPHSSLLVRSGQISLPRETQFNASDVDNPSRHALHTTVQRAVIRPMIAAPAAAANASGRLRRRSDGLLNYGCGTAATFSSTRPSATSWSGRPKRCRTGRGASKSTTSGLRRPIWERQSACSLRAYDRAKARAQLGPGSGPEGDAYREGYTIVRLPARGVGNVIPLADRRRS